MKNKILYIAGSLLLIANLICAQSLPVVSPPDQLEPVILKGGRIHTGTGDVIEGGSIAFKKTCKVYEE